MTAEAILEWADGTVIRETAYRFREWPRPTLVRGVGDLVGEREVVVPYNDPVWKTVVEIGPLAPAVARALQQRTGEALTVTFSDTLRTPAVAPHAPVWYNHSIACDLLDARPYPVNADATQGDRWALRLQWLASAIGARQIPALDQTIVLQRVLRGPVNVYANLVTPLDPGLVVGADPAYVTRLVFTDAPDFDLQLSPGPADDLESPGPQLAAAALEGFIRFTWPIGNTFAINAVAAGDIREPFAFSAPEARALYNDDPALVEITFLPA